MLVGSRRHHSSYRRNAALELSALLRRRRPRTRSRRRADRRAGRVRRAAADAGGRARSTAGCALRVGGHDRHRVAGNSALRTHARARQRLGATAELRDVDGDGGRRRLGDRRGVARRRARCGPGRGPAMPLSRFPGPIRNPVRARRAASPPGPTRSDRTTEATGRHPVPAGPARSAGAAVDVRGLTFRYDTPEGRAGRARPSRLRGRNRHDRRDHRHLGLGKDDPALRARWTRPPAGRKRARRRPRAGRARPRRHGAVSPRGRRVRLPGLRPARSAHRARERGAGIDVRARVAATPARAGPRAARRGRSGRTDRPSPTGA